jgi:hypothetical protein
MSKRCEAALIFGAVLVSAFAMTSLSAGTCGNPCGIGTQCNQCQPCQTCTAQPCQCAQARPQVQYRQQVQTTPTVTYKDVVRTQYRMQPQTQTVPVTTYRQVTVDEGQWQKIWVPKPVTKQVPQTTYQQRTTYRQVPYQVTQRVPQVSYRQVTTMVPTVAHRHTTGCNSCGTVGWNGYHTQAMASPIYSPYGYTTPTVATYPTPAISSLPTVIGSPTIATYSPQPVQLGREIQPLDRRSASSANEISPVPDPKYLDTPRTSSYEDWPSRPRTSNRVEPRTSQRPEPVRTSAAKGLFVPAPSAVSVWRTRDTRVR